jgi:hypothetical protein
MAMEVEHLPAQRSGSSPKRRCRALSSLTSSAPGISLAGACQLYVLWLPKATTGIEPV